MFSHRTNWSLTPNAISRRLEALRKEGVPVIDLTESNPTRAGIRYPEEILKALSDARSLVYEPSAKGFLRAREAIASLYAQKGVSIDPDRILLTASTSEAYSFLFRLLADPGDRVLVPKPSYPLLEYLAGLCDVEQVFYPLRYAGRWTVDIEELSGALTIPRTKAVVLVHPNNPTGSCVTQGEQEALVPICRERGIPLVVDEVFADYRYQPDSHIPATLAGNPDLLTFALGGLSKFLGLPQMKLAWIAASGPAAWLEPALERLEIISDTFLSVNTPVQAALPQWLSLAPVLQSQIRQRLIRNRRHLLERLSESRSISCLEADGGWNAVLQVPSIQDEESWVLKLLEEDHLLVHPGFFFDFDAPGFLVISLLVSEERFQEGIGRLLRRLHI